jgi:ribonuclease HI
MGSDKMIPRHVYNKPFSIRSPDRSEWKEGFQPDRKCGLIWCTDGSKTNKGTGAGVYCYGARQKLSFRLWQYTTIFQAEMYAIKACAVENLDRNYKNRNICFLSDSQAAIKALGEHQITLKLVWDCHQSLAQLTRHNIVQLIWVPGHEGIVGNETADQRTSTGSENLLTGPEPACSISIGVAKKAVKDWANRNHKKCWESTTGLKQAKGPIPRTSARRTKDLLKLNRDKLKWMVGLITGHCHLKGHLFKLGLTDDPNCER